MLRCALVEGRIPVTEGKSLQKKTAGQTCCRCHPGPPRSCSSRWQTACGPQEPAGATALSKASSITCEAVKGAGGREGRGGMAGAGGQGAPVEHPRTEAGIDGGS